MYADNTTKFTIVVNRKHSTGVLLNAIGHLSVGLAADLGPDQCELLDYQNDKAPLVARISRWPVIVLGAKNSSQVCSTYESARDAGLRANVFVTAMLAGSAEAQLAQTAVADPDELDYVGVALFGNSAELGVHTRRFSLLTTLA